jgi:hypothetical protein
VRRLDNASILALKKEMNGAHKVKLVAYRSGKVWIVTNGAWLMEWPENMVEDCPQLHKLIANGENVKKDSGMGYVSTSESTLKQQLSAGPWRDRVLSSKKFQKPKEVDPTDKEADYFEEEGGAIVLQLRKRRYYYCPSFIDAAELFLEPDIMLQAPNGGGNGMLLGFFDGDHLVGACMNKLIGPPEEEGEEGQ